MDLNILGVGLPEVLLILVIAVVFAGPKRMMQWAYMIGRYTARMRAMFQETMNAVRKEFEAAQIDLPPDLPRVPRTIPRSRFDIVKEANKLVSAELNRTPAAPEESEGSGTAPKAAPRTATAPARKVPGAPTASSTPRAGSASANGAGNSPQDDQDNGERPGYDAWRPN